MSDRDRSPLASAYADLIARGIVPEPEEAKDFEYPTALLEIESIATDGSAASWLLNEGGHGKFQSGVKRNQN